MASLIDEIKRLVDGAWGLYLSRALKLDRVRSALERGDVAAASRKARVFELIPLSA